MQHQKGGENYVARLTLRRHVSQVCCASAFPLKFEDSSKSNSKLREKPKLCRAAHLASVCVRGLLRVGISIEIRRFLKNRIQHQRRGENYVARLTLPRYVSQVCCASAFPSKFEGSSKIQCKIKGEAKLTSILMQRRMSIFSHSPLNQPAD